MIDRWYVAKDKKRVGPLSAAELADLIRSGQVQPVDMVLQEGAQSWVPISQAVDLLGSSAVTSAPSPVPVPVHAPAEPPSSSPVEGADPAAPSRTGRAVAEIKETARVTRTSLAHLVRLVRCTGRRWRSARALNTTSMVLGRQMAAAGVGDDQVRGRIEAIDRQIERGWLLAPSVWRGKRERNRLYVELAHSALESVAPEGLGRSHAAARKALERHERAEQARRSAASALLPGESTARRRVAAGCGVVVAAGLLLAILVTTVAPAEPPVRTTVLAGDAPAGSAPMALAPDLRMVAGAGPGNAITLWALPNGHVVATLQGHEKPVQTLDFAAGGKWLASVAFDRSVCIWDVAKAAERRSWTLPADVLTLQLSPDGDLLATGLADGSIKLWVTETGTEQISLLGYPRGPLAFSPDGKRMAAGGYAFGPNNESIGVVKIWDVVGGGEQAGPPAQKTEIYSLAYSPDGRTLAAGSRETVQLWDVASWERHGYLLHGRDCNVRSLAFSPDSKWLATGGSDKQVATWAVATGTRQATLVGHRPGIPGQILCLAFARDALVSVASDGTVVRWNKVRDRTGRNVSEPVRKNP